MVCNLSDKARRWLHNSRRAHSHQDRAFVQCFVDSIQLKRDFAEPANVRANPSAAVATRKLGWESIGVCVAERRSVAGVAAALEKLAVHVDDALRSCLLVQVVNILGADEKAVLQQVFKLGEGEVCRIRFDGRSHTPPHGIELPHQPGIAVPSFGRSDLFDPVVPPKSTHATESWDAAFGAHSCPGENEDAIGGGKCEHG